MQSNDVHVNVATPAGVFEGTFPKTAKVRDVVNAIVEAMNLAAGDLFNLVFNGTVLEPDERPLVSFGITGSAELDLVATGSGVCLSNR